MAAKGQGVPTEAPVTNCFLRRLLLQSLLLRSLT